MPDVTTLPVLRSSTPPAQAPTFPTDKLLGHLADLRRDPLEVMLRAWRSEGDIVRIRAGHKHSFVLSHPRHVQHVLVSNAKHYSKDTRGQQLLRQVLGRGLLTSQGEHWKRQRRIANPVFRRRFIAGFAETMSRATEALIEDWRDTEGPIDLAAAMMDLTLRIAGETLFSMDISAEGDVVGRNLGLILEDFTRLTMALPGWERVPTPKNRAFHEAVRELDEVVHGIIRQRRASGEQREDLLGMFMSARDEETGEGMSDEQLRDEVLTMLLAGHETTANALTWAFILLSRSPELRRRLEDSVDALGEQPPGPGAMRQAPYVGAVISEAMRLYPPAWIESRKAERDDMIDGVEVPAGAFVFISQYIVHRHPDFWDNPEGFDPERFMPEAPKPAQGAYLPFGAGPRMCIGSHFARMEAFIVLSGLTRRFRLDLEPGQDLSPKPSITLRPGVVMARVSPRP